MSIRRNNQIIALGDVPKGTYHPDLFSVKWSDHLINDIQWLRGDTFSWQSGNVYTAAYNKLVEEYTKAQEGGLFIEGSVGFYQSPNGYKIAAPNMEAAILDKYNTDGRAWYYILDTANKRFKLPRTKFGFEGLRDVVGSDIVESLPNITGEITDVRMADAVFTSGAFGKTTGTGTNGSTAANRTYALDFDASRSSSTYRDGAPVQERATQMYLYFYVGSFTQSAIEQTAGLNADMFNSKVDSSNLTEIYPVIKRLEGASGYRIWSDGYCEQWGDLTVTNTVTSKTFFVKPFKYLPQVFMTRVTTRNTATYDQYHYPQSVSEDSFTYAVVVDGVTSLSWRAFGYLAEGQY